MINLQVMHEGYLHKTEKIISIGTVSLYPANAPLPFKEKDIWEGYPEEANAPYGIAKRIMHVQSSSYRKQFGYESFKSQQGSRKKIVLVGSNGGMLHAFDDASGEELWAFIPPNILPRLREIISSQDYETNSISGVDDTPVVKDIYYDHDDNGSKTWRTIALTGLGRGGKGLFALDILILKIHLIFLQLIIILAI